MERRLKHLEADNAALVAKQNDSAKIDRARAEAEDKLAVSLRSYSLVAAERDQLHSRVAELTATLERNREELAKAQPAAPPSNATDQLELLRRTLKETEEKLSAATQKTKASREIDARLRRLEDEKSGLLDRATKAEDRLRKAEHSLAEQLAEKERAAENDLTASRKALASLTRERDELTARITDLSSRLAAASPAAAQLDALRARASAAEFNAQHIQSELAQTRRLLAQAQNTRPTSGIGPPQGAVAASSRVTQNVTPADAPPAATASRRHTVASGETLSGISRQYYGTPHRWREILAANRDVVRDEKSLVAGRTLRIP